MATNSFTGERSVADIAQDVIRDIGEVIQGEARLAKAEMREKLSRASKPAVWFGVAALCGVIGFAALVFAAISALTMFVSTWAAALIVGAFLLCIAGAFAVGGRARLKELTPVPERTVETLKDDVEWAKHPTK